MKSMLNLQEFKNKNTLAVLKDIAKQLDEANPVALQKSHEEAYLDYEPLNEGASIVIERLIEEGVMKASTYSNSNKPSPQFPSAPTSLDTAGAFFKISFTPDKLDEWIANKSTSSHSTINKIQPIPQDVEWDEVGCVLKIRNQTVIQFNKSTEHTALFKIYIKNHGRYISHKEVEGEDKRFSAPKISSTILTLKRGKLHGIERVEFQTQKKGAYRLIIKEK